MNALATVRLADDQLDQLADRIAARLKPSPASDSGLIDAQQLAYLLGVSRTWVYEHAAELGARRLGGPRGRLRFDQAVAVAKFTVAEPEKHAMPPRPRRRKRTSPSVGSILQVRR
jgi:hypothetical protein